MSLKIRASDAYSVSLCPGKLQACQGLKEREGDEVQKSGTRIHKADAGEPVDPPLTLEEQETLENIQAKRAALSEAHQGLGLTETITERLYETDKFTGHPDRVEFWDLPKPDIGYEQRAIIVDAKTGFKEQTEPAMNKQLAVYAYLVFEDHPDVTEVIAGLIPSRFKTPVPVRYQYFDLLLLTDDLNTIWEEANKPDARRIPGIEQCRYCLARGTDRCPETQVQTTQLFKAPPESLLKSLSPSQKGQLLDECLILEGNIKVARERLLEELQANPEAVQGWQVGTTRGQSSIKDANEAYQAVSDYLAPDEFAACCKPRKGKVEDALKAKLRGLPDPIKGVKATMLIKDILAPVIVKGEGKPTLVKINEQKEIEDEKN